MVRCSAVLMCPSKMIKGLMYSMNVNLVDLVAEFNSFLLRLDY